MQGDGVQFPFPINDLKGEGITGTPVDLVEGYPDDFIFHPIVVANLKRAAAELPVPADTIQQFMNGLHGLNISRNPMPYPSMHVLFTMGISNIEQGISNRRSNRPAKFNIFLILSADTTSDDYQPTQLLMIDIYGSSSGKNTYVNDIEPHLVVMPLHLCKARVPYCGRRSRPAVGEFRLNRAGHSSCHGTGEELDLIYTLMSHKDATKRRADPVQQKQLLPALLARRSGEGCAAAARFAVPTNKGGCHGPENRCP
jgi:hypothetical protein